MVLVPVPLIIAGGILAASLIVFAIYKNRLSRNLKNKRVIMLGPSESGKSTIVEWITKGKISSQYNPSQSISNKTGTIRQDDYTISFYDMGGAPEFLENGRFEIEYSQHDVVFFVFDINKYASDLKYQVDVNSRLDGLKYLSDKQPNTKKIILLIGSHKDCYMKARNITNYSTFQKMIQDDMNNGLKEKNCSYFVFEHPIILANLTDKKDVTLILKSLLDRLNQLGNNE